jgi:hypothetical protein
MGKAAGAFDQYHNTTRIYRNEMEIDKRYIGNTPVAMNPDANYDRASLPAIPVQPVPPFGTVNHMYGSPRATLSPTNSLKRCGAVTMPAEGSGIGTSGIAPQRVSPKKSRGGISFLFYWECCTCNEVWGFTAAAEKAECGDCLHEKCKSCEEWKDSPRKPSARLTKFNYDIWIGREKQRIVHGNQYSAKGTYNPNLGVCIEDVD